MHSIDQKYRDIIGMKLSNRLSAALKSGEIVLDDLGDAINMILPVLNTLQTKEDIFAFLGKLAQAWPFFGEILSEEMNKDSTLNSIEDVFTQRNIQMFGVGKAP